MATKKNQILVPDHIYVPKHEIISKQEAEEVLKKYNCKPTSQIQNGNASPMVRTGLREIHTSRLLARVL